jgi:hypothetical protein
MSVATDKLRAANDQIVRETVTEQGFRIVDTYGGLDFVSFAVGRVHAHSRKALLRVYCQGDFAETYATKSQLFDLATIINRVASEMGE